MKSATLEILAVEDPYYDRAMPSGLGWVDSSPDDNRRVREMIRMFSQSEAVDELGGRQIFVALSDLLFPGTSVLHTRARYLVFLPWIAQIAAKKSNKAKTFDTLERELIVSFNSANGIDTEGLIGRRSGKAVKQLPSQAYWSALSAWGIVSQPGDLKRVLGAMSNTESSNDDFEDELSDRRLPVWHPGAGAPPPGFPRDNTAGGFTLTRDEALWIQERWRAHFPRSLLSRLADSDSPLSDVPFVWDEPLAYTYDDHTTELVDDAHRFSIALRGAQLLFHLMLAEECQKQNIHKDGLDVDQCRQWLKDWRESAAGNPALFEGWSSNGFWDRIATQNPRAIPKNKAFFELWFFVTQTADPLNLADRMDLRRQLRVREASLKSPAQRKLHNPQMLKAWKASLPAQAEFRWSRVRRLVNDVHVALGVVDART